MAAREPIPSLALAARSAAACGPNPQFVSPAEPLGPPPFIGPSGAGRARRRRRSRRAPPAVAPLPAQPTPLVFYKTQDSSDWIAHNFKIQARYARVIAVYSGDHAAGRR